LKTIVSQLWKKKSFSVAEKQKQETFENVDVQHYI